MASPIPERAGYAQAGRCAGFLALATVAWSCTPRAGPEPLPARDPEIAGVITVVRVNAAGTEAVVLIEAVPEEPSGSAKASVRVIAATRVRRLAGARPAEAGIADLEVGQRVRAWFAGPVRESYPVQATAEAVLIEAGDASAPPVGGR